MRYLEKWTELISARLNWIAAAAVVVIMVLTCADVVLRFFGRPITGTYEMVGLFGSVIVSLALAQTSLEKGHIAVEILMDHMPEKVQAMVETAGSLLGAFLFGTITWQSYNYAAELKQTGEVSLTLGMPTYPFAYGIMAGCGALCLVLMTNTFRSLARMRSR
jgi:TRAP-type C4-dicarboxylate transport system permease small subunit